MPATAGRHDRQGVDGGVAAIMLEPIMGNGGHIVLPKAFHEGVRKICDARGIVLIWDEIQSGFGRTGEMFAADYYGIVPDIMTFGKGIGGGFPLAGIFVSDKLDGFDAGDDGLTFGNFPVAMAAAIATVDAIISDGLCENARRIGQYATQRLVEMSERRSLIGNVRGPGPVRLDRTCEEPADKGTAPHAAAEVYRRGVQKGVLYGESRYAGLGNLIKVKPPLDCTQEEMSLALMSSTRSWND